MKGRRGNSHEKKSKGSDGIGMIDGGSGRGSGK
jgi:hypothetical protein